MPLNIVRNDIIKMQVDAIVNTANTELLMGGGVCGAVFSAAGAGQLQEACDKLSPIRTGDSVITDGFALAAKYIIHTAGPVYIDGKHDEEALLRSCYLNSLELAKNNGCESIAFPLISSGIYSYPKDEALSVATSAIGGWLATSEMDVFLVMFDKAKFKLSQELHGSVQSFIDENYAEAHDGRYRGFSGVEHTAFSCNDSPISSSVCEASPQAQSISYKRVQPAQGMMPENAIGYAAMQLDEPFSTTLLRLIDLKGRTDVEVYKRANIDRKLFSKIRTGKDYLPSKKTIIAFAVALELSLAETRDLLERAGFALSRSVMFDVIIEYFITQRMYDIYEINNVLFEYDQSLLGA